MVDMTPQFVPFGAAVAVVDKRAFLERALAYAAKHKVLDAEKIDAIRTEGAKGIVQIADFFGTAHLRANIEEAKERIVALASLYLEESCEGNLARAALSLRDNSFLSHSRGGSDMLKLLNAMPRSTLYGDNDAEAIKDFLAEWSLHGLRIHKAYRDELALRREVENALNAGEWFAEHMGIARVTLQAVSLEDRYMSSAESVARTAILLRITNEVVCPSRAEFAKLVIEWRAKGIPAALKKQLLEPGEDTPPNYAGIEAAVAQQIVDYDLPLILDKKKPLDETLNTLEARYYLRPASVEDISEYDAMVSAEWHKITQGRAEPDARLTVFMCIGAGLSPKPQLTEAAAKKMLTKIRAEGLNLQVVRNFINETAPFDLRESLLELWDEEFIPEAEEALFDPRDEKLARAMGFMKENLRIVAAAPRKKAS